MTAVGTLGLSVKAAGGGIGVLVNINNISTVPCCLFVHVGFC